MQDVHVTVDWMMFYTHIDVRRAPVALVFVHVIAVRSISMSRHAPSPANYVILEAF